MSNGRHVPPAERGCDGRQGDVMSNGRHVPPWPPGAPAASGSRITSPLSPPSPHTGPFPPFKLQPSSSPTRRSRPRRRQHHGRATSPTCTPTARLRHAYGTPTARLRHAYGTPTARPRHVGSRGSTTIIRRGPSRPASAPPPPPPAGAEAATSGGARSRSLRPLRQT